MKVQSNLSNYLRKTDLKNATRIDTSSLAKKVDLASLKSNVDNLDIDKLKNVSIQAICKVNWIDYLCQSI